MPFIEQQTVLKTEVSALQQLTSTPVCPEKPTHEARQPV
jgi:hypothetical protein